MRQDVDRWHSRSFPVQICQNEPQTKRINFLFWCRIDSGNTEGGWSEWSEWTECSRQCGIGRQQRTRTCDGPAYLRSSDCDGPALMERTCNLQPCKGVWSCWTEWSACSVTCGQGTRSRSRTCSVEGGDDSSIRNELAIEGCDGPSEMKEYCNNPSCERKSQLPFCYLYKNFASVQVKTVVTSKKLLVAAAVQLWNWKSSEDDNNDLVGRPNNQILKLRMPIWGGNDNNSAITIQLIYSPGYCEEQKKKLNIKPSGIWIYPNIKMCVQPFG